MPSQHESADTTAKLMLIGLSFAWGLTWPAMRIALDEIPPFSMRVVTLRPRRWRAAHRGQGAGTLVRARRADALRPSGRLRNPQRSVIFAPERDRDDVRRDRAGRDARLHDADLGRAVCVVRARRTADTGARHRARAVHRRHGDPHLPARAVRQSHRPAARDRHRGELGGRHCVYEMGAHGRRSGRERGVADCGGARHRHRLPAVRRRHAAPLAGTSARADRGGVRRAGGIGARLFPVVRRS